MKLSKEQYTELIKALELREYFIGMEILFENNFESVEITKEQEAYRDKIEQLKDIVYREAHTYGVDEEIQIDPDTSLRVLKTDGKLQKDIFHTLDKIEIATTYETIVKHIVSSKVQEMKRNSEKELQFSEMNMLVQPMVEKLYRLLVDTGLDQVLRKDIVTVGYDERMKYLFQHLSEISIKFADRTFTPNQIASRSIGTEPVTNNGIEDAERRLNIELPQDYKILMGITNGYSAPSYTEPSMLPVESIDYLRNIDSDLVKAYSIEGLEETGEALQRSILVGGMEEEQHFLLIPPSGKDEEWQYWKFANWIPGEEPYEGMVSYMQSIIEDILAMLEEEDI